MLLVVEHGFGQSPEEIERSTIEVDMLLEKATQAQQNSEKRTLAEQSLNMARSLHYDGGVIKASICLGKIDVQQGKSEDALQHYLEAEAKVQSNGNKTTLLEIYQAIGDLFTREKLYANARRYYQDILKLQGSDFETMEKLADAYLYDQLSDTAEIYYKRLIVRYKESGNVVRLVRIYQKLANAYDQQGNAGKSLYYYLPIEDLIERFGSMQEKSILYNNLGRQYATLHDYKKAIEYFEKAELQCVYIPCDYPDVLYANMGIALHNIGNTKRGIEYLLKARTILANRKDNVALANLEHLLAGVYFKSNDLYNAISHNNIAMELAKETKQATVLAEAYKTAADLYHELYDFEKAFAYYKSYLNLVDSVRLEEQARQQRLNQQRSLLSEAEGQIKYLIARQNYKDLELGQVRFERERLELLNKNLELESRQKEDKILLYQAQEAVDQSKQRELISEAMRSRQALLLAARELDTEKQKREISELKRQDEIERTRRMVDSTSRAQEVAILRKDKDITDLQLRQQDTFRRFVYGLGSLLIVILGLLALGWAFARRTNNRLNKQNRKIQAQNLEIAEERHKSDRLLRNVLPEQIAQELKTKGYATPRYYDSVTVVFTDFVNFTRLSANLAPEALVDELDECFLAFDEICEKHGLEKIKTIGDAYMCAGGIPIPNETHPTDAVAAAAEMLLWLQTRNKENENAIFQEMRIGVHTGPVVAGVIGKNKFAYDIWGDAVNLAARLEQHGVSGKINISTQTAEAVKDHYKVSYRGVKEVYNKDPMDMYFIDGRI
ncbi:MAG: adenylate/guanylate cyclase domain-containing protein [Saprospiraceae bacterium]|nr:adenylate/guanylate cyclase domain-containing protein [Saprospiraceae bacterium]